MKKLGLFLLVIAGVLALNAQQTKPGKAAPGKTQEADLWVGEWKLNLAKSKFHRPAPRQETIKIEAGSAEAVKYTVSGTSADGKTYTETYDGKPGVEAPLMRDGQPIGKITYHRISARKTAAEAQMADGSSVTEDITLAANGKSFTARAHIKDAQGEHDEIVVFTR